jgi:hypothetical protein
MILMAGFYYIIDILHYKKWAFFFKVIGMNSILIYMSYQFVDWSYTASAIFPWLAQTSGESFYAIIGEPYNVVVLIICSVAVQWGFLYFLYKKEFFLRV